MFLLFQKIQTYLMTIIIQMRQNNTENILCSPLCTHFMQTYSIYFADVPKHLDHPMPTEMSKKSELVSCVSL